MSLPRWSVGSGMPEIGPEVDVLVLVFSREEVEGLRVGRGADDLMSLLEDERLCRQLTHGLVYSFEGYDDDAREVHEIPACRRYMQALHAQFPHWLHFLMESPDLWGSLLLLLLDPAELHMVDAPDGSKRRARSCDGESVTRLLQDMLVPLQLLHQQMNLTSEQSEEVLNASLAAIRKSMSAS